MTSPDAISLKPPRLEAAASCLFLDFDGTLVDIVERPENVVVDDSLIALLKQLNARLEHRLAIVSGRSIAQLEGFFGGDADQMALVGSHGAEIRLCGTMLASPHRPRALDDAENILRQAFADRPQILIEVKSFGVAIHYRLDPSMEEAATVIAMDFAQESGLELQQGKMMVELRTAGHDKGSAIRSVMLHAPFAQYTPIFVGDDLTDEAGFEACASEGGFGVLVGQQRPTNARYQLENVAAVRQWLGVI
jgi:trehalose 6-phosphate phosphatase